MGITEKRQEVFRRLLDERLGMFVHYGIYSAFAGYYRGEPVPGLGEWIQKHARIPIAEYEAYGREHFCPAPDFARKLVAHAKSAGIRYIVLTSKHHDGYCLFRSEVSDYSSYGFFGRDLCRELAEACREAGLGLGFYYSHTLDWHEKNAAGNYYSDFGTPAHNRNSWDFPEDEIDFEQYLEEKCFPQVRELLTNYGELKLIWFDFPHDITREQSARLRNLVKSIQPDCLINSRIAHNLSDYESLGDNSLPSVPLGIPMECLVTMNDTWGYHKDDHNWKTATDIIDILCRTLTADATLLLNVGPMADGSLTAETTALLEELGKWTACNKDAVYGGISGNPLTVTFPWGYPALKGKELYLYVKDSSVPELSIAGIKSPVAEVTLLGTSEQIAYRKEGDTLSVVTAATQDSVPVYRIAFSETPFFEEHMIQCADTLTLNVRWAYKVRKGEEPQHPERLFLEKNRYIPDFGRHGLSLNQNVLTSFWADPEEELYWEAVFTRPGDYEATVVHALPPENKGELLEACECELILEEQTNPVNLKLIRKEQKLSKTGSQNIRIGRGAGVFTVPAAGIYRIRLSFSKIADPDCIRISHVEFIKKHQ